MLLTPRFWLGILVTVGFLFLFLWKVDFEQTGRELRDANYAYLTPAVLVYFASLGLRSLRWRFLLLHLKTVPATRLYPVVCIGYLANNILPARLGELVRAHFLGEKEGISKASALATIMVERVLDGLTLMLLVVAIWPFLPWTDVLRNDDGGLNTLWLSASIGVTLAFSFAFTVLLVLAISPERGRRLAHLLASPLAPGLRAKVEDLLYLLLEGLGALRSWRKLLLVSAISLPVWLLEALSYYIIARSFGLDQPFEVIVLVTATSNLVTAIPSSMGGIGPFEVVAKSTLVAFGVTAEAATAYAFFVHIVTLWLPINLLGMLFLWKQNLSLVQLAQGKGIGLPASGAAGLPHLASPPGTAGAAATGGEKSLDTE